MEIQQAKYTMCLKYSKIYENQHCALRYILEKRSLLQCTTLFIHKSCADPCQIRYSISKSTSDACRCRRLGVLPLGHNGASISGVESCLFCLFDLGLRLFGHLFMEAYVVIPNFQVHFRCMSLSSWSSAPLAQWS